MSQRFRGDERSYPMPVRLTPREREIAQQAARVNHQTVSQFLRDALLTAASECLEFIHDDSSAPHA